ncbi:MAG: RsmB/NOP family class I SAM-dependent RNA methyltransferase [Alphaproteobacteria bacterium]|nr:RsmB/NOP family class I SAM-dependent RNA methyltransferase [Alphaproteobacteria bacterium]
MQISAKYQAVLEILSQVMKDKYPADNIIKDYMRQRKYIGSKDRKFITSAVWDIIRHRSRLSFECSSRDPRMLLLTYLKDEDFDIVADGSQYGLQPLTKDEKNKLNNLNQDCYPDYVEKECPQWLYEKINNPSLIESLNGIASADIRSNFVDRRDMKEKLKKEGLFFSLTPYSPYGLRSAERINLQNCIAYQNGEIEVQDESCQIGAILCDVRCDQKIIDYCCGAGGKSLLLGVLLHNKGEIYAHDKNPKRTVNLNLRAERLGVKNIKLIDKVADGDMFDRFIIDAPCSGSGTWRRSPDAKYRLTVNQLNTIKKAQTEILEFASQHLTDDGRIIYMTCSVLPEENEEQIEMFLSQHPNFETVDIQQLWERKLETPYPSTEKRYMKFSPLTTNTDGFFICILQRK